jgi:hypothetical protein
MCRSAGDNMVKTLPITLARLAMFRAASGRFAVFRAAILLVFWIGTGLSPATANAAQDLHPSGQLLMVTSSHCPWCEAFEDEVGHGYARTKDAEILPLRRHDFYAAMPADLVHITPATMTPTFIILKNGEEVGRIIGYPGAELFWWRLSEFTTP